MMDEQPSELTDEVISGVSDLLYRAHSLRVFMKDEDGATKFVAHLEAPAIPRVGEALTIDVPSYRVTAVIYKFDKADQQTSPHSHILADIMIMVVPL